MVAAPHFLTKGAIKVLIIDRFEGDWAVIEFGDKTFDIPRSLLPKEAREGDVIQISISIDNHATRDREEAVRKLADELFEEQERKPL